jgi:arylsulfatase A-like enzyme
VHEGGISTPLIVQWPNRFPRSGISHTPCHVVDILPTILEAANARYPSELGGHAIQRPDGESLMPLFAGAPWERQQPIYWEHEGNAAARVGNLKLVRKFDQPWELYDMQKDRTELHDLGAGNQPMLSKLTKDYEAWAQSIGVVDWKVLQPKLLKAWGMKDTQG